MATFQECFPLNFLYEAFVVVQFHLVAGSLSSFLLMKLFEAKLLENIQKLLELLTLIKLKVFSEAV